MTTTLSDAVMNELNKAALSRTGEFIFIGHETSQKATEFRREASYLRGCISSALAASQSFNLPEANRRVAELKDSAGRIENQLKGWRDQADRLIDKMDGAGAALVVSAALNEVLYSGENKDELRSRYSKDGFLFLGFTLAGDGPVSAVLSLTSPTSYGPFTEATKRISEVVASISRNRIVNMADSYLDLWGATRHTNFTIQARRISSPWKVWGDVMDLEHEITDLLADGDKLLGEADKAFEEMNFIRDMYARGAFIIQATDTVTSRQASVNLAEVENGTVIRTGQWSCMRTSDGWVLDDGTVLSEDEMASNTYGEDDLSLVAVSGAGVLAI